MKRTLTSIGLAALFTFPVVAASTDAIRPPTHFHCGRIRPNR